MSNEATLIEKYASEVFAGLVAPLEGVEISALAADDPLAKEDVGYSRVRATQSVAKGDFTPRVPRWANDEIGNLATAFNTMTEELRREREGLRR